MSLKYIHQNTRSTIPYETKTGNKYIYDRRLKKSILCHPLLYLLAQIEFEGKKPEEWMRQQENKPFTIEGYGTFSPEDIQYYYRKYLFLKGNGYFAQVPQGKILDTFVTPEVVERSIANLGQITFEITDACNLQCEYCGYGKFYCGYDKRENKYMDIAMAKSLIDHQVKLFDSPLNLSHNGKTYISFYGGEPLLNFDFIKNMVQYIENLKEINRHFVFAMTTNALLLEKYMNFLVEHDFNLLISLDGNETNNGYRVFKNGKPAYGEIIRNVESLRSKYPEFFKRKVFFNAVLHNKNSVEGIYRYFKDRFDKTPSIAALNASGVRKEREEEFWNTYTNVSESLFNSENYSRIEKDMFIRLPNIQTISSFIHYRHDFCFFDYNELLYGGQDKERFPTGTCFPFSKKMFVTVNGKILACERISQEFELGRITGSGSGLPLDYQKISDMYNRMYDKIRQMCGSCFNIDQCVQCLFYLDLSKEKLSCNAFLNASDYSEYLTAYYNYIESNPLVYDRILAEVLLD